MRLRRIQVLMSCIPHSFLDERYMKTGDTASWHPNHKPGYFGEIIVGIR
jgi:hypothetical protein